MQNSAHVPDLEQLRALTVAAGAGSLSAAARSLGVSQQALSARVRSAERLLGVAVFERSPHGVRLTGQGGLVVAWAQAVLDAADALGEGVLAMRTQSASTVRVASSNTVSECLLPDWSLALRAARPDVHLEVSPGNSHDVLEHVAHGGVDLGFVEGPGVPRSLRSRTVATDELVVVVPRDHPWAGRPAVDRRDLQTTPLVLREEGSGTRTLLEQRAGGLAAPVAVLSSSAAVRDGALTLGAPTVLSSLAVSRDLDAGRLVRVAVRDLPMPRRLRAVWHPNQPPRGAAADLLRVASGLALR